MTSERTAQMINPTADHCKFCNEPIKGEPTVFDDYDEPFCNQECFDAAEVARAERQHEANIEAFYGGSSAFTAEERYNEAWEEKRRLG